jgi:hypothetical protein
MDLTVCTLDRPERWPPARNIWVQSRLPWVRPDPALADEDEEAL